MARFDRLQNIQDRSWAASCCELEIGKVCELANGQVMVRYGDTVVNVTGVRVQGTKTGHRFFPAVLRL